MSNTINILSIIDVQAILNANLPKGTATSPTFLGSYTASDAFVYMIASSGFIDSNDTTRADSELVIDANIGDTIQWELSCPGSGLQHNAIIASVVIGPGGSQNSISAPEATTVYRHLFSEAGSPGYQVVEATIYTATVLAAGTTQYSISFQIMDNSGNSLGYYAWDPFVKVPNSSSDYAKMKEASLSVH